MNLTIPADTSVDCTPLQGAERSEAPRSNPTQKNRNVPANLRLVAGIILLVTVLAVFVPLEPMMPVPGLDPSWMFDMNQAVAQHLVFGRDIVLTFGPYASIYTELYHPATDRMMICGSLFLGLSYFLLLFLLGKNDKPYHFLLYALVLAAFVNSRDALLYSYPLMVGLLVYRLTLPDGHRMRLPLSKSTEAGVAILFVPLGLLPLIKVSLLPLCGITLALCCALLWNVGKKTLACMAAATTAISCILLWAVAGQPLLALPTFILNTEQMIAGYTEAMAFPGDTWECILYIVASALTLVVVMRTARGPRISRLFLGASYAFFLFTAFKGGFVRHDPWHNITAGSSILIAAVLLLFVVGPELPVAPIVMSALAWAYIGHGELQKIPLSVAMNFRATVERALVGGKERLSAGQLQKEYDQHIATIRAQFPLDKMPGTMDIYSVNQAWLFASGNVWAPRPIAQSYEAYTPDLARLNLLHLAGSGAPDNIVFRVEPIDGRLPSLEDGLSWPAIINGYSLVKLDAQSAYLRKRSAEQQPPLTPASDFQRAMHKFGEEVPLPETQDPLSARLEITPTLLGKMMATVYKPPQLHMTLRLRDGSTIQYRVISAMMKTEFMITPLVKRTEDFALLAAGGMKFLGGNEVKSFSISSDDSDGRFWNPAYSLSLQKVDLTRNTETENARLFDWRSEIAPVSDLAPSSLRCEGSIESLNGNLPSSKETIVRGALYLNGWMAVVPSEGVVPDSVFVTLKNDSGKTFYVRAHGTRREDIKNHFSQPDMPDPGYAAMVDVSDLKGLYTLGLARMYRGNLGICRQFKFPLLINP